MAGETSSSRLPAAEGGPALTFRPRVTPGTTQFLDRMGRGGLRPVHRNPKGGEISKSGGLYRKSVRNSTGERKTAEAPGRPQTLKRRMRPFQSSLSRSSVSTGPEATAPATRGQKA